MGNRIMLRIATMQDIGCLSSLYSEFHNFHARRISDRLVSVPEQPDLHEGTELYTALKKIIQSDDSVIIIAEADQQPVGLAEIYIQQDEANPLTLPYRYGYLQSLMVTTVHRQQGIGTQLVKSIEQWAKERDATEIRLDLWEFGEGPLTFYELLGYRTLKRTMIHRLNIES